MKRFFVRGVLCALVLAGMSVQAMPLGVRTLMHARAVARQSQKWTVTFDAQGGVLDAESDSMVVVPDGIAIGAMPTPTRTGYTFAGWFTAAEGGERVDGETPVSGDMLLYAYWLANKYIVTFYANGGIGGWRRAMEYGSAIIAPTVRRIGHDFTGWVPEVSATVPNSNVTYVAQWTISKYSVMLELNGGEGEGSVVVEYGAKVSDIAVPKRTGYTFAGWSETAEGGALVSGDKRIKADITLYAQWTANKHTITFDANGGEGGLSRELDYGAMLFAPRVTRDGYTFVGWLPKMPQTVPDEDVTYVAQWAQITSFTVVLHKNDGTGTEESVVAECGEDCFLPGGASDLKWAPRRGFMFMGWSEDEKSKVVKFKDKENVKDVLSAGETIHVYAIWQLDMAKSYAIQYIRNDGSGMVRTIGFNYGEPKNLNSVVALGFARRGYTFGGWAKTTEDARNKIAWKPDMDEVSTAAQPGKLLRVYAIWTLKEGFYSIRFNKNDGSGKWRELGYEYGKNTTLPTIENGLGWGRPGYTFVGWRTKTEIDKGGTKIWLKDKGVTKTPIAAGKTLSIYAIWEKNSESAVEEPAVCTGKDCASAGTAVAEAKLVEALVYFADGEAFAVEASVASDGWTVVELDGSVYCGYTSNGMGRLTSASGDVLFVATALK